MKNVHLLPTDKPSRLQLFDGINEFEFELCSKDSFFNKGVHIYITSHKEIKEGDWCINLAHKVIVKPTDIEWANSNSDNLKKIILTTDQDLIKDGVQAIDDEFLEWFVKNPSCEWVKVKKIYLSNDGQWKDVLLPSEWEVDTKVNYKIIIPKEDNIINQWLEKHGDPEISKQVEQEAKELFEEYIKPKKETLEEAYNRIYNSIDFTEFCFSSFKIGSKWQQERSYSEEEVLQILYKHTEDLLAGKKIALEEWFKKFKK